MNLKRPIFCLLLICGLLTGFTKSPAQSYRLKTYHNSRYGFLIQYPDSFTAQRAPENGDGLGWKSKDGLAYLTSYGSNVDPEVTIQSLYADALKDIAGKPSYARLTDSWFVLSWEQEGTIYYQKVFFGEASYNGFQFSYPAAQKGDYAAMTDAISKSFHRGDTSHSQ